MIDVIGVRFRRAGKMYYFDPAGLEVLIGENVIVETSRGIEMGEAVIQKEIGETEISMPLKKIIRVASEDDEKRVYENTAKAKDAFKICIKKIEEHRLKMKLIDAEITFDNSKILFYFTAEGRIDFRDLVKDLAAIFKTRIELRQIGVRDEAKIIGGLGICGRELCCCSCLTEFQPVSIKMAKEQGLSLNPSKISGCCGRLMCCLRYEQEVYEELVSQSPKVGAIVQTPDGQGIIIDVMLLKRLIKVKIELETGESEIKQYKICQVKVIKDVVVQSDDGDTNLEELKHLED